MRNTSRTELCSVWESFVRDPSDQTTAKKAQQWRPRLLTHVRDCDICTQIKFTRSRDTALIAKYLGLERRLTQEEKNCMNEKREAARNQEERAIAYAQDLVAKLGSQLGDPMKLSPHLTPLALFQCIRAIEMIVRRILHQTRKAGDESGTREPTYLARNGTIHLPDRKISRQSLISELALAADVPQHSAASLLDWILEAAYHHPDLFHGFTCEQEGERVRIVSTKNLI